MSQTSKVLVPTAINLHRKSRILEVEFNDGRLFEFPCEYLRVFSPAADTKVARSKGNWILGKEDVNIERVTPVGHYAIQLTFDDHHDAGVFSWQTLYELGINKEKNWAQYQAHLKALRTLDAIGPSVSAVKVIYFATLVQTLGTVGEEVELPNAIENVGDLLAWLRARGANWRDALLDDKVTITINKQFAGVKDQINKGDEISITPNA